MERTYIIPLRKEWLKVPIYKRTKKAVNTTRLFLQKHMKVETVKLGRHLNMALWTNGNRNPPHKVEVHVEVIKDKEGDYAYAELVGKEKETLRPAPKEVKKSGIAGKLEELTKGVAPSKDEKAHKNPTKEANHQVEEQKAEEEKEKEKVLMEKSAKKELRDTTSVGKDVTPEANEKVREETLVKRDMKQDRHKEQ